MIRFIENIGDYFASNYFDEDFARKVTEKSGFSADDLKSFNNRLSPLKDRYYRFKQQLLEERLRPKDRIRLTHEFHSLLLSALGYPGEQPEYKELFHLSDAEVLPIRHKFFRGDKPYLFVMEMQPTIRLGDEDPDGLFDQRYLREQWEPVFRVPEGLKLTPSFVNEAVSQLFLLPADERPHYILLLSGNALFLLQTEKWFRGSYLRFDLEALFDQASLPKFRDFYALFYFLCSRETLAPEADVILMEQLDEDAHKSAYAVTQDLQEGIILAVEALANEALHDLRSQNRLTTPLPDDFANKLKDDCLTLVYRLLFLFYAESRGELQILPVHDEVYQKGYSLEMLRDLEQVPLHSEHARNSFFFHESLKTLFQLLCKGYRESEDLNKSFRLRHLDSPLFDDEKLHLLGNRRFRNFVWQDIIRRLSLSKKQRGRSRGRISYANLGVNQLGSVYEGLLAYRGFIAQEDLVEVHPKDKPDEGCYLVPRRRLADFQPDEVLHDEQGRMVVHPQGQFIYRLSGRDRQKSASFYTPEVLTRSTVQYTLKPLLDQLRQGQLQARELLELKILEPAMGAAAFHNEAINQLAPAYLDARQRELGQRVKPGEYQQELQKVKAYLATNNTYGVDLNPTAVELGKLALWLNVIHQNMETPFFGHRLGVGNAVVGAWLRVYSAKQLRFERGKGPAPRWWEQAPRALQFQAGKTLCHNRKADEIYHFLLPDPGMGSAANIGLLKDEYPEEVKRLKQWSKALCEPLRAHELQLLQTLCTKIDELFQAHARFQAQLNASTRSHAHIWGAYGGEEQARLDLRSYAEKERLAAQREESKAPYFKLKLLLNYWCALWYWDPRQAAELPSRQQWYEDLCHILDVELPELSTEALLLATDQREQSLFSSQRRRLVQDAADQYRFFHYHLEFVEVFAERGGFDLIVGNPPWIKIEFEEKGIVAEQQPEVLVRKTSAPQVRKVLGQLLQSLPNLKAEFLLEALEHEGLSTFLNAAQNYPLLQGQQTNLYKNILENTFRLSNPQGFIGLVHPEGIYDDPKGAELRREVYQRLRYHFQFKNELMLFSEIDHHVFYGIHVYAGSRGKVHFYSMNNLFHPMTIDGSMVHDGHGMVGGYKVKDPQSGRMVWNIHPHRDRILPIGEAELRIMARTFEDSDDWAAAKLVSIHSRQIISVLEKLSQFPGKVGDVPSLVSEGWHETAAQDKGIIRRETRFPDLARYELIYSGPHFFVGNPLYKTPREVCTQNSHYDEIDLCRIPEDFVPRTNYVPNEPLPQFRQRIKGFSDDRPWIEEYKVCFSKMLSIAGERTLQPAIIPPKVSHIHGVISNIYENPETTVEVVGVCSSLVLDFYIKSVGKGNIGYSVIKNFPLGLPEPYRSRVLLRTLLLNCVTRSYADLWARVWRDAFRQDTWMQQDARLPDLGALGPQWQAGYPLRTAWARRQALLELDVLVARALGLSLEELLLIYEVQFPVLQQNEDDTWYDAQGHIVFTCSRGLTGVGLSRQEWEQVRQLQPDTQVSCEGLPNLRCERPGELLYTITRNELYQGQQQRYLAPFLRYNRQQAYRESYELREL